MKITIDNHGFEHSPRAVRVQDENGNDVPALVGVSWKLEVEKQPEVELVMQDSFPVHLEGYLDEESFLMTVVEKMNSAARQRLYERLHAMGCRINR